MAAVAASAAAIPSVAPAARYLLLYKLRLLLATKLSPDSMSALFFIRRSLLRLRCSVCCTSATRFILCLGPTRYCLWIGEKCD